MLTVTADTVHDHLRVIRDVLRAYANDTALVWHIQEPGIEPPNRKIKRRGSYTQCIVELALYKPVTEEYGVD